MTNKQREVYTCGASRQVAVETTTGSGQRTARINAHFLMNYFHDTELINQIAWCRRCAGINGFARRCDASNQTVNSLDPVES